MSEIQSSKPPQVLKLSIISVVVAVVNGILLMGLPGGMVLELIDFIKDYFGQSAIELSGDAVWPTAIMISLLWPLPITPLSMLHHRLFAQKGLLNRWIFSLTGSMLLTVVITYLLLL